MTETAPTQVVFACARCGQAYSAVQFRSSLTRASSFKCLSCDAVVIAWMGDYDYGNWKPLSRTTPKIGLPRAAVTRRKKRQQCCLFISSDAAPQLAVSFHFSNSGFDCHAPYPEQACCRDPQTDRPAA